MHAAKMFFTAVAFCAATVYAAPTSQARELAHAGKSYHVFSLVADSNYTLG